MQAALASSRLPSLTLALAGRFERPLDAPRLSAQQKLNSGDIGEAASDIVQLVKPRSDWWEEGPLSSPFRGSASTDGIDPLDKVTRCPRHYSLV
jgi:hypothetical protein